MPLTYPTEDLVLHEVDLIVATARLFNESCREKYFETDKSHFSPCRGIQKRRETKQDCYRLIKQTSIPKFTCSRIFPAARDKNSIFTRSIALAIACANFRTVLLATRVANTTNSTECRTHWFDRNVLPGMRIKQKVVAVDLHERLLSIREICTRHNRVKASRVYRSLVEHTWSEWNYGGASNNLLCKSTTGCCSAIRVNCDGSALRFTLCTKFVSQMKKSLPGKATERDRCCRLY